MKFTTARRLIKEQKHGKGHPQELIDKAHQVCHLHHDRISKEKAAAQEVVNHIQQLNEKMAHLPEAERLRVIPAGVTPEQFAERQVRLGRQGRLKKPPAKKPYVDTMGNESAAQKKAKEDVRKASSVPDVTNSQ